MAEVDERIVAEAGLDGSVVLEHQENVLEFLKSGRPRTFSIQDTCRLDNGGIVRGLKGQGFSASRIVSFIPAAGASSRWRAVLSPLMDAAAHNDVERLKQIADSLISQGYLECPLPPNLRLFLVEWSMHQRLIPDWNKDHLLEDIESPKAFYPAVIEGTTFLELKHWEDRAMGGLAGEVFVAPHGRKPEFEARIKAIADRGNFPVVTMEQGLSLATVRWTSDGQICLDESGRVASVPAGHGSLMRLLPEVRELFPQADSVWIRNIDNVTGVSSETIQASKDFLATHEFVLDQVKRIRLGLSADQLEQAGSAAHELLEQFAIKAPSDRDAEQILHTLARSFFHVDLQWPCHPKDFLRVFGRPVVTMGQVPNSLSDVGGTAVFASIQGRLQKLCLEVPHASSEDKKTYLENSAKATHFNPVFVAMEIPTREQVQGWRGHPFWLVAQKSWRGQTVWYQESILYEMIGSSAYTNVVFVEIPRRLFNPHKTLADARGRTIKQWTV